MESLTIFIPALNEEKHIGNVIGEIPLKKLREMGFKTGVLVVNGPSTDRTEEIAKKKGATVIQTRKGKGNAVRDAFNYIQTDYTIMLDADETYPGEYIIPILGELEKGSDVVLGSRLKGSIQKGAMSGTNLLGNRGLTFIANLLFGSKITDLCTGYWGFRKKVIKGVELTAEGFDIEANLFSECTHRDFLFTEIPITYRTRGDEPKLNAFRDGVKIARRLFDLKFLRNPRVVKYNMALLPFLLAVNLVTHLAVSFGLTKNFYTSNYSFGFLGFELAPFLFSSTLLVLTYSLMIYMTKGNFLASTLSSITLVFSFNFLNSITLLPFNMLIGFGLFIAALYGILVTFGRENIQRYVFTLIPYATLFIFSRELFTVLFFVFLFYLATEFKSIASKRLVLFWAGASVVMLVLASNLFSFQPTAGNLLNVLYYVSLSHFIIAMVGFYFSVFSKRAKILVILLVFMLFFIYLNPVISTHFLVSYTILVTMLVYTIILLTGIGLERLISMARKLMPAPVKE